ncbi:DNA repair and recombination protein RAD54B isoform X1 [Acipenser oxyrinchus oxyrinchus]|uniref:DNA repair and recombination protein RAD54B isoform X1 n=1 Tax=Acipenser oxyrinchus oxyrinchus TaxID=40147 RepID=A0AAD8GFK7_ACIOX|nr:DNA repair and recombination protein RAD54B isoform X1 [Acipenser oxyrinchus oxyrinchus]
MAAVFMTTNMAAKARSSNFTLSEKLDLLKLVKPHIRILEEHTNKHAVIMDKNKCWDSIAEQYNIVGGDRPPRTAQGLRTLYKRLKESAKQEMVQRKHAQPEYRGSISEPTKRVMEMIPHLFRPIHDKDHNALPRMIYKHDSAIEQPGSSSSLPTILDYQPASVTVKLDQEVDVKPPPELTILSTRLEGELEEDEDVGSVHSLDGSISPCPSSVNLAVTMSPSPIPMRRDNYSRAESFRHLTGIQHETLQLSKAEHELVMDNHRKMGLYIEEKREGLKRKQQLEEELLKDAASKIYQNQPKSSRSFLPPKSFCSPSSQRTNPVKPEVGQNEPTSVVKYFSVVWCKASKKKHKRWEGDAVLVTRGRTVILKDIEGKDIGRGTGYKSAELEGLTEGQTLMVGGKEIEIMGSILPEDFSSGRCFHSVPIEAVNQVSGPVQQALLKPFSKPLISGCKGNSQNEEAKQSLVCKPRHNPFTPDALVMPRPSMNHQWMFNKAGLQVVDVVVDPYLGTHLRPHQREGIIFLYECVLGMRLNGRCGAILADEMGLGKTLQCISLVWTLLRQGPYGSKPVIKQVLIVTPGSLVRNWSKEFQKWLGTERIQVFAVDQDHKVEDFINSPLCSVLIISYEMLLRSLEQIQKVEFNLIICDEGHRLKNSNIKTSSALTSLSCDRRVILTGTPVQNDLQEFYAIIEFVNPGILGSACTYRKIYEEPVIRSRQPSATEEEKQLGQERAAELGRLTGLFILRRTQEIINRYLPPKVEWIVFCEPAALQLEVYRKLLTSRTVRSFLQGATENSPHLVCIGALKKLCNHPGLLHSTIKKKEQSPKSRHDEVCESALYEGLADLFPEGYAADGYKTEDSGKLQVLADLLAAIRQLSPAERVVLVSNYTQTLDMLQEMCQGFGYSCTRLDGQTPVSQRQQIVEGFNSRYSSDFLFLLSSKAGGVGLNLVGASHLILYDIDWNPANDMQAMARVWRDGQKRTVHIYRFLTTGTIEEKIYQRQISKQGLSGAVVDLTKKSNHTSFSVEELRNLFTLHEDSECVTHDLLNCSCGSGAGTEGLTEDVKLVVQRSCQLGHSHEKPDSQKHLSMSELMQWKHYSGKIPSFPDLFLDRARKHITFAFQNKTKHQTPSNKEP